MSILKHFSFLQNTFTSNTQIHKVSSTYFRARKKCPSICLDWPTAQCVKKASCQTSNQVSDRPRKAVDGTFSTRGWAGRPREQACGSFSRGDPLPRQPLCHKLPGSLVGFQLHLTSKGLPKPFWSHGKVCQSK